MTYSNAVPPNTTFAMITPPVRAPMEMNDRYDRAAILEHDVEITLPSTLRPEFGFAGKTVPFKTLLRFLEEEGAPVSRDRDLTLRHEAERWAKVEEGILYDHYLYADLPPQALQRQVLSFPTGYVLHLVADDIADADPDTAEYFRGLAETYYAEPEDAPPSEEEIQLVLGRIEDLIAAREQLDDECGDGFMICQTGPM